MVEAKIVIHGSVQGVFFRSFVKEQAQKLRITGWVKNEDDGTVKACAQGDRDTLESFIDICKIGPSGATVEKVDVEWKTYPDKKFSSFSVG
ncbi:MAG TPA: acylphosphatase [Candidatus Gracilibacteria bacterium]|nr:acylphosphatase [Candidatus Gracilibacteria bacterium]